MIALIYWIALVLMRTKEEEKNLRASYKYCYSAPFVFLLDRRK